MISSPAAASPAFQGRGGQGVVSFYGGNSPARAARFRLIQSLAVCECTRGFQRHTEAFGQGTTPIGEGRLARPVVEAAVDFHHAEVLGVDAQPRPLIECRRVEDAFPVIVTPTRRADMNCHVEEKTFSGWLRASARRPILSRRETPASRTPFHSRMKAPQDNLFRLGHPIQCQTSDRHFCGLPLYFS